MSGLGARTINDATVLYAAAMHDDNQSGGLSSGPVLVPFLGAQGSNLDTTALLVWVITGAAIAVVLGIHFSFGGRRLL